MSGVSVSFSGLDSLTVRLREMPAAIRANVSATIKKESLRLESVVKEEKLSGGVLNNRTGRLYNAIHSDTTETPSAITGAVYASMAEAGYARFWEYGFSGIEQVREHLRHMTVAFGHALDTPKDVLVRAHSRHVDQPARSYLRSTLEENRAALEDTIMLAAGEGLAP